MLLVLFSAPSHPTSCCPPFPLCCGVDDAPPCVVCRASKHATTQTHTHAGCASPTAPSLMLARFRFFFFGLSLPRARSLTRMRIHTYTRDHTRTPARFHASVCARLTVCGCACGCVLRCGAPSPQHCCYTSSSFFFFLVFYTGIYAFSSFSFSFPYSPCFTLSFVHRLQATRTSTLRSVVSICLSLFLRV